MIIKPNKDDYSLTYLSLGAGVQSIALLIMSALELKGIPKIDLAIFSDTGDEPEYVYRQLERCKIFAEPKGIDIITVQKGKLSSDVKEFIEGKRSRVSSIPVFTKSSKGKDAPLPRQCTADYKIEPINAEVRRQCGLHPRQRMKSKVLCLMGISLDEVQRMKDSRHKWLDNYYPLIVNRMNRFDCQKILKQHGFDNIGKSSCVYCPFHSDAYWTELKDKYPNEFAKAVEFDKLIRHSNRTIEGTAYLHRSMQPLDQIDFSINEDQPDLFNYECEGMCGV